MLMNHHIGAKSGPVAHFVTTHYTEKKWTCPQPTRQSLLLIWYLDVSAFQMTKLVG